MVAEVRPVKTYARASAMAWLCACAQCVEPNPNLDPDAGPGSADLGTESMGSTEAQGMTEDATGTTDSVASTSGTPSETGSTGAPSCPASTHACVTGAPNGWAGPAAVVRDKNRLPAPPCDSPFDVSAPIVGYADLVAPPAECACECDAIDADCSTIELVADAAPACDTPSPAGALGTNFACLNTMDSVTGYVQALSPTLTQGVCAPDPTSMVPAAVFAQRRTICDAELEAIEGCAPDEVCAPQPAEPFADQLCVWSAGDLPCPVGLGYDARELLYAQHDDTRGCTACSCGEIGGTCTGTVALWSGADCNGSQLAELTIGGACEAVPIAPLTATIENLAPAATCGQASGAQPAGQAVGTEPLTLCCRV